MTRPTSIGRTYPRVAGLGIVQLTLGDLFDVDLTGVADGDIIIWDAGTNTWVVTAPSGSALEVTDGTTSVTPTDSIDFDPAFFDVSSPGGGVAGVTFVGAAGITVEDEGSPLTTNATTLDFVGAGVVASGSGATKTITIAGGGSGITIQDEGSPLSTAATTLDFTGSGVTATGSGATKTINIPGGSGSVGWALDVNESGTSFASFTGGGGTWSSNGTEIIQTDTGASWRRAKFNTFLSLGFPTIIEAECQIASQGSGGIYRVGIGITKGDSGSNGLSFNVDSQANAWSVDKDNSASIAGGSLTIDPTVWYKLRAVTSGGWVHVYIDGTRLGAGFMLAQSSWEDEATFFTLLSYAASVKFRNIKAWTLSTGAPA